MASGFNYKDNYKEGGVFPLKQWQNAYGYDKDSIEAEPLFVDVPKDNFKQTDDSPCSDMGTFAGGY